MRFRASLIGFKMIYVATILKSDEQFTVSLFREFEAKLNIVFGFSYADLKTTLDRTDTPERKGYSVDQEQKLRLKKAERQSSDR